MITIQDTVFTYHEILSDTYTRRLPEALKFVRASKEALMFRLLLGTINISHNFEGTAIKQRINYSILGRKKVTRATHIAVFDCQVSMEDFSAVNSYFSKNRNNTSFFEDLLSEFSNYFYQTSKNSHLAAFVHLYRATEHLSYAFPLIYAKKSDNYKGTFKSLKSFFSNDAESSELNMFKVFQNTLIDESILQNLQLHIDVDAPTLEQKQKIAQTLLGVGNGLAITLVGTQISIYYKDFFDFILRLRNRFFHLLLGSERNNISSKELFPDLLFKNVNEEIANWISYFYFEICKYGVAQ